jgi:predicted Zn-dependent protease
MRNERYRQEREELKELLTQYDNLRAGRSNSFLEQEGFERLVEYFDEKDKFEDALTVCEYAINQYPNTAALLILKANLLIVTKKYKDSLTLIYTY